MVTVFGGEAPHNVNDHVSTTAPGILTTSRTPPPPSARTSAGTSRRASSWSSSGPEHAATIAADGFTRADVQRFVYEHARLPLDRLKQGGMWGIHDWPRWMETATTSTSLLPRVPSADDVYVMVAGGSGKHSTVVPNCTFSRAVSRLLDRSRFPPSASPPAIRRQRGGPGRGPSPGTR